MDFDVDHIEADDRTLLEGQPRDAGTDRVIGGRYRLLRLIGSGGMAQVWSATDTVLNRQVAVKILHPYLSNDSTNVARFKAEAVAAARLNHQNIVAVFDTCSDDGSEAIVMELLAARTLRQHLSDNGPLEVATTVRVAIRVLAALEAAHNAGLIHRDVKPSNILLCDDGRVKIADFGIAKVDGHSDLTQEQSIFGTAAYLSPEQVAGLPTDARSDLYSLGIVMYECLTGSRPFEADTKEALARQRTVIDPVDPRRLRAGIPAELAESIMRLLERDPDDRFQTAADLRAVLLDGPIPPTTEATQRLDETGELPVLTQSLPRSERRWLVPAVMLMLIAIALVTVALLLADSADELTSRKPATTTGQTVASGPVEITQAVPFDPQGDSTENNASAARAIDGDDATAWKTEGYNPPGFSRNKSGVGLELRLARRSTLDGIRVAGSSNGWSGSIFVIDSASIDSFDPTTAEPVGEISDFDGPVEVKLSGSEKARTGSSVLVWITDLGGASTDGRHRVEISSVSVTGSPAD
ncbi:MAG: protein kinase [Microthrixaceae bacterium]